MTLGSPTRATFGLCGQRKPTETSAVGSTARITREVGGGTGGDLVGIARSDRHAFADEDHLDPAGPRLGQEVDDVRYVGARQVVGSGGIAEAAGRAGPVQEDTDGVVSVEIHLRELRVDD